MVALVSVLFDDQNRAVVRIPAASRRLGMSKYYGCRCDALPTIRSPLKEDGIMKGSARILATTAILLCAVATEKANAGGTLDQSNVVSTFSFDAAVVSEVSRGQTFTVGLAGVLSEVDVEIYKSTNTIVDPTFEIVGTTGGVPDDTKLLYKTTIPLSSIPTFDTPPPGAFPLTPVDVSSAGIVVTPGEVLAITLARNAPGNPPWLLWRQGIGGYPGGSLYDSIPPGAPWTIFTPYEAGFQTFVSQSVVPEPSAVVLVLIGLGSVAVPFRLKFKRRAK
jgi:hypothetical protein